MSRFFAARSPHWFWWPGVAVALAGGVVSFALWQQQRSSVAALAQVRFEQQAQAFADRLRQRMESHSDLLQGMRGLLSVNPQLRRSDFERVASQLEMLRNHPGIKNIHFVRHVPGPQRQAFEAHVRGDAHMDGTRAASFAIHPPTQRPEYFVVDFIWPLVGNADVLGLEIHSQPTNLEALYRTHDTGTLVASAPFELIQFNENRSGIVMRLPVYASAAEPGAQGSGRFLGALGVAVRIQDVMQGLRSEGVLKGLTVTIADVGRADALATAPIHLFGHAGQPPDDFAAMRQTRDIDVAGRIWRLELQPSGQLLSPQEASQPRIIGLGSLVVTGLLTALVLLLSLRRAQALVHVKAADTALGESEARFQTVFDQAAVGIAQTDSATGRLVRVNQKFCDLLGYTEPELRQLRFQDVTDPQDLDKDAEQLRRMRAGELPEYRLEKRCRRKDGRTVWVDLRVSPLRLSGEAGQHIAVVQDITERKQMEQALRDSEQRLRGILNHMPVGVNLVQDGAIVFRNARHVQICGYDEQDAPDVETWWRLAMPEPQQRQYAREIWLAAYTAAKGEPDGAIRPVECVITSKAGVQRAVEMSGMLLESGHIVTMVDQSQRKAAEEEVRYLANNDTLTGLSNRRLLIDRLQQALSVSMRHLKCGAVLMLDLDNFKNVNETLGHEMGDRLLRAVAQRLHGCMPEGDTLARHGGDEFVLVLEDLGGDPQAAASQAEEVGRKILSAMRSPFVFEGMEPLHITLSVGITIFQGQQESADELLKRSDLAMYEAKAAGRDTLRFFDPQMQAAVSQRVALEADMRSGLEKGQFELFYQPKVVRGRVSGAEALLRWRHPERGFIAPSEFIPLAEQTGLILRLGEWVLRTACQQLAQWSGHPVLGQLTVAVNVSPRQFHEAVFVPHVLAALAGTGAEARLLRLELTESMLLQDVEDTIAKMVQLRGYGVGFSLDDFGTGYSSLAYLKRLPLHELKIDQSFVRDVLTDPNDAAIARTIVALGTSLGLLVIAEGVETEEQRTFLERSGCTAWQGYLLSPPVQVADFEALVLRFAPPAA